MSKQLHPGLFQSDSLIPLQQEVDLAALQTAKEIKRIEARVQGQIQSGLQRYDELFRGLVQRIEKMNEKVIGMEARFDKLNQDVVAKHSQMNGKLTEKMLSETKTQALVDRHNQLLRQFEQRTASLQKMIEDQEMQILNYQALLEEARREIVRLKTLSRGV